MDKLNEWTKQVINWAKDRPADAILVATGIVVSYKLGTLIGDRLAEAIVSKLQS
jgi:hypothetical protein